MSMNRQDRGAGPARTQDLPITVASRRRADRKDFTEEWPESSRHEAMTILTLEPSDLARISADDETVTIPFTCDPRVRPEGSNGPVFGIPLGRAFYWASTSGPTWSHDYTTWGYYGAEGTTQFGDRLHWCPLRGAHPGRLVTRAGSTDDTNYWAYYTEEYDRSRGGTKAWLNDRSDTFFVNFYINDRLAHYGDNIGFMNFDLVIYRA